MPIRIKSTIIISLQCSFQTNDHTDHGKLYDEKQRTGTKFGIRTLHFIKTLTKISLQRWISSCKIFWLTMLQTLVRMIKYLQRDFQWNRKLYEYQSYVWSDEYINLPKLQDILQLSVYLRKSEC